MRQALAVIEGVDLVCRLEDADGQPLVESRAGRSAGGLPRRGRTGGEAGSLPARRRRSPTCAAARWQLEGDLAALEATVEDGRLRSETYPDPLARVWSALSAPHAGDFLLSLEPGFEAVDWGGVTHAGGGSHGSLHAGDSLGPLLFVGCGPSAASEREQWTLSDVAPGGARALRPD